MTGTTQDVFNPNVWSGSIIKFRESALHMAMRVDTSFGDGITFGQTIEIPTDTELTAAQKSEGISNTIAFEANVETKITVTIDQHWYTAILLEEFEAELSKWDLESVYKGNMRYGVGKKLDLTLNDLIDGFTQIVGQLGTANGDQEYRDAIQELLNADVPGGEKGTFDDWTWYWSPAEYMTAQGLNRLSNRDFTDERPVSRGILAMAYGIGVMVSTNAEGTDAAGHDNALFHRSALGLHVRMAPRVHRVFDVDNQGWKITISEIWAVKELRDDHGVFLKGK